MKIAFKNFKIEKGRIDFTCQIWQGKEKTKKEEVWFELDNGIIPGNDAIAYALSTFAGTGFAEVEYELPISAEAKKNIENFTKAVVTAPVLKANASCDSKGNNVILNFSGGFDSLAALCLMPADTKLVSIDFGSWFERERKFFEEFHPYILKTNFRQLKLDKNSWTFMGTGSILYCGSLNAEYHVFGTIMEATTHQFAESPIAAVQNDVSPFCYAGLKEIRYTNGLTEVGTAIVVSHYLPDKINDSLISLANPKTEKRFRKQLLLDIVCEKFDRKIIFDKTPAPDNKIPFGTNFAVDFLCLYILKNRGLSAANETVSDIPEEVLSFVGKLDLNFYERINCEYISGSTFQSNKARSEFMGKVLAAGILPYTEKDYKEFRETANFLNKYHHYLKQEEIPVKKNFLRKLFK